MRLDLLIFSFLTFIFSLSNPDCTKCFLVVVIILFDVGLLKKRSMYVFVAPVTITKGNGISQENNKIPLKFGGVCCSPARYQPRPLQSLYCSIFITSFSNSDTVQYYSKIAYTAGSQLGFTTIRLSYSPTRNGLVCLMSSPPVHTVLSTLVASVAFKASFCFLPCLFFYT